MSDPDRPIILRGRHAPPLPERLSQQRARLFRAAATVFARSGYGDATAEAIAREAGMSKATFYEHFDNKEECIIGLFDEAFGRVAEGVVAATRNGPGPPARLRIRAFLGIVAAYPDAAQTLLVEMIGAGPRAAERRDDAMWTMAQQLYAVSAADGKGVGYETEHDAFAVVGAMVELVSRQLRRGEPETVADLAPVSERLAFGLLRPPPA